MSEETTDFKALREALDAGPTGGRWRWEINLENKRLHLVGGPYREFDLTIMDFDRWGMSHAVATLRDPSVDGMNVMHRLPDRKDWVAPFPGRAHHANWCQQVTHPDMRWIQEASPKVIRSLLDERDRLAEDYGRACKLVADMHAAAVGEFGRGPQRGVIEDVADLKAERDRMASEVESLRVALRFYGTGEHFHIDPDENWDSVSGEPENWLCSDREGSTTMFENGTVARMALQGKAIDWSADGEDCTPSIVPNEAPAVAAPTGDTAPDGAKDAMDWPLPCDVTVGHGTMRKGVKLRTLVARMKVLYEMATGANADEVAARTPEERAALAAKFLGPKAAP